MIVFPIILYIAQVVVTPVASAARNVRKQTENLRLTMSTITHKEGAYPLKSSSRTFSFDNFDLSATNGDTLGTGDSYHVTLSNRTISRSRTSTCSSDIEDSAYNRSILSFAELDRRRRRIRYSRDSFSSMSKSRLLSPYSPPCSPVLPIYTDNFSSQSQTVS